MGSVPSPAAWMEPGLEAGLLVRAQEGAVDSYWELIQHYGRYVYRMAYALTRDREQASLMTLHVLVQAWRELSHFPIGRPFLPWLLRMVRAQAVAQSRGHDHRAPTAAPVGRSRTEVFESAYAGLGVDEQLIVALSIVERLSHGEIGATLDLPPHTALSRLSAARERLRARVAAQRAGAA